jgi:peptidoglycan/xylan/chitin deacetylase (PgdA/CDA1 family)
MKVFALVILFPLSLLSFGQKKQVCFSFDDLPFVNYEITDTTLQKGLVDKLILSLKSYKIPAIGFLNEKKLYNSEGIISFQVDLLNKWIDNGLDLGNHTFSHLDYNSVSLKEFSQDVLKGETITREILNRKNMTIKYFRHPFLHVGNSKVKADSLNNFLLNHGYIVSPVTIDNEDYLFARAYEKSKVNNNKSLMLRIGHDYISYMEKKLKYFEKQTQNLFGRDINQILLLHASFLNSDYIDSLAIMFQKNNYAFISIDKALKDKVYKYDITRYGDWGISWIDRWALSQGKKGDFFKDEPITPDYIGKLANQKN